MDQENKFDVIANLAKHKIFLGMLPRNTNGIVWRSLIINDVIKYIESGVTRVITVGSIFNNYSEDIVPRTVRSSVYKLLEQLCTAGMLDRISVSKIEYKTRNDYTFTNSVIISTSRDLDNNFRVMLSPRVPINKVREALTAYLTLYPSLLELGGNQGCNYVFVAENGDHVIGHSILDSELKGFWFEKLRIKYVPEQFKMFKLGSEDFWKTANLEWFTQKNVVAGPNDKHIPAWSTLKPGFWNDSTEDYIKARMLEEISPWKQVEPKEEEEAPVRQLTSNLGDLFKLALDAQQEENESVDTVTEEKEEEPIMETINTLEKEKDLKGKIKDIISGKNSAVVKLIAIDELISDCDKKDKPADLQKLTNIKSVVNSLVVTDDTLKAVIKSLL